MEQRINGMSGDKTRDSIPAGSTYAISADDALSLSALIMTTVSPAQGRSLSFFLLSLNGAPWVAPAVHTVPPQYCCSQQHISPSQHPAASIVLGQMDGAPMPASTCPGGNERRSFTAQRWLTLLSSRHPPAHTPAPLPLHGAGRRSGGIEHFEGGHLHQRQA